MIEQGLKNISLNYYSQDGIKKFSKKMGRLLFQFGKCYLSSYIHKPSIKNSVVERTGGFFVKMEAFVGALHKESSYN